MRPDLELAWAAGFFDGEGTTICAYAYRRHGRSLQITVGQKNRSNLERFQSALGGLGTINGPDERGMFRWRAYSDARRCVGLLWPLLGREKQDQALRALISWAWREIRPEGCQRGHTGAMYVDPRGRRECLTCRDERRSGPLPRLARPTAFEVLRGVRVYTPSPLAAQT